MIRFSALCGAILLLAGLSAASGALLERDESALLEKIASLAIVGPENTQVAGFASYGGNWTFPEPGVVEVDAGPGWRLVPTDERFENMTAGEVACELFIPEKRGGFSGINFKVSDCGVGADAFNGYEIGFNPESNTVMIGAHRRNFTPLATVPFEVPIGRWFEVIARFNADSFTVMADGKELFAFTEPAPNAADVLHQGTVALRSWQYPLRYRNLRVRSFDSLEKTATDAERSRAAWTALEFAPPAADSSIPETLALDEIPPFLVLVREPLARPNSVGNDLWMAHPLGPGAEIRLVDPAHPSVPVKTIFSDPDGAIYDMNLSFDAATIFFSYKKFGETYWHLWKIGVDGIGLTQLTDGPFYDVSPCEMPNGELVFVSTRRFGHTVCQPGPASNLFTMKWNHQDGDADSIRCVSMDTLSDFTPQILPDGRVLFTRWEYVDRDLTYRQSLWTQNPDGTAYQLYFGNTVRDVGSFLQARPFPGNDSGRVIATFAPHHNWPHGAIGEIDRAHGVEGEKGRGFLYWSKENPTIQDIPFEWGWRDPFPVFDDVALAAYGADSTTAFTRDESSEKPRFKIWLLDKDGNRRLVYEDAQKSVVYPILLAERPRPAAIPNRSTGAKRALFRPTLTAEQVFSLWEKTNPAFAERKEWGIPEQSNPLEKTADGLGDPAAVVVLVDVYNGIAPAIERGRVKKLRIMEQIRKTEDLNQRAYDQSPVMSYATYYAKRCWGEVPVEEDGSAHFYVPALREIYFQALDENGQELQRMTSAAQFMPGESLSCMGCHEPRETVSTAPAADAHRPTAATRPAIMPILPAGMESLSAKRTNPFLDAGIVDYPSVVQPILDRYCVACHSGSNPDGGYDLTGDTTRYFSMSYDNLLGKSQSYRQHNMYSGEMLPEKAALEKPLVHFFWLLHTPSGVNQPLWTGSHASRLPYYFTPEHCNVQIPDDELRLVWLWLDADVPYYGTFANSRPATWGKRDLWNKPDENVFAEWLNDGVLPIYNERCAACHLAIDAHRPELAPMGNISMNWEGKFAWINLTRPENSPLLTAHLSKEAGGRGLSTDPFLKSRLIFRDTNDPAYQKLLEAIRAGAEQAQKRPRADQPGFAGARPEP